MPFQRLQTVPGHEMTISDQNNENEPATLLFLSFFLACLFACFVCSFVSSLSSAANKGQPSRLQQQLQQKELHLQETLETRSGAKPRRRSASCTTAMGKKPSEIRQKKRPKRNAFPRSVQRYIFFPQNGVFRGGVLFMPTFAKGQKSARKKLEFAPPLYTRSQGQSSTQIKQFYWCKKLKSAPKGGLYTRSQV